jgi:hypothetical protein
MHASTVSYMAKEVCGFYGVLENDDFWNSELDDDCYIKKNAILILELSFALGNRPIDFSYLQGIAKSIDVMSLSRRYKRLEEIFALVESLIVNPSLDLVTKQQGLLLHHFYVSSQEFLEHRRGLERRRMSHERIRFGHKDLRLVAFDHLMRLNHCK